MRTNGAGIELTGNQLKVLAVAAMVLDHSTALFIPRDFTFWWLLRMIGRIAAPIMCYLIAEGYYHTSSRRRYAGRLLRMALVSHIPYCLCFGHNPLRFWRATSVMVALLAGLMALWFCRNRRTPLWQKGIFTGVCCLLAYSANWNYIAVLWVLGFGLFHGNLRGQLLAFSAVSGLYLLQPLIYDMPNVLMVSRLGVFLCIPLLLLYRGQRGRRSNWIQWGFYWFYPIHLLALWIIRIIFQ